MKTEQINQITNLREFLISWDTPLEPSSVPLVPLRKGRLGNINLKGTIDSPAPVFTRHHPQFLDSLEAGVKELVLCLIEKLDCITYSSCAGHTSEDGKHVLLGRNVNILPRTVAEYEKLRVLISEAIRRVNAPNSAVLLQLDETVLESDELNMPCLDINFRPTTEWADLYFDELEFVYQRFLKQFEDT